jgi:hypothetical protein
MTLANKTQTSTMTSSHNVSSKRREVLKAIASAATLASTPFAFAQPKLTNWVFHLHSRTQR